MARYKFIYCIVLYYCNTRLKISSFTIKRCLARLLFPYNFCIWFYGKIRFDFVVDVKKILNLLQLILYLKLE